MPQKRIVSFYFFNKNNVKLFVQMVHRPMQLRIIKKISSLAKRC